MRAAVCREFGKPLTIEDVTLAPPEAGEVRVRIKACSICHSDLSYAQGIWGGDLPAIYGHEGAGIVEEAGPGVSGYAVGDHVLVTLVRHCGECRQCAGQMEVQCEGELPLDQREPISGQGGEVLYQGMNCGAFAEEVVVHQSQLQKLPEDMPFDVASLLACGVITGYGAARHAAGVKPGDHVIVIGCGGVGLNSVQGAALAGAASVIAMDLEPEKLEVARSMGATHGFNPTGKDTVSQVMAITDGRGADHVLVTVGAKPAIDSAQRYLARNGRIVIVGMPAVGTQSVYDPVSLAAWGQRIVGTKMGNTILSQDIPELLKLYAEGQYQLDTLISGRFTLDQVNEAMDEVRSGKAVKNVIVFD